MFPVQFGLIYTDSISERLFIITNAHYITETLDFLLIPSKSALKLLPYCQSNVSSVLVHLWVKTRKTCVFLWL